MVAKKLGRGLDALIRRTMDPSEVEFERIAAHTDTDETKTILALEPSSIRVNRAQPRTSFNDESIAELAQSIKRDGVLQPVVVRHTEDGAFELIAGERRLRAAILLGLAEIPAIVKEVAPEKLLEFALIENIQREDLNAIELAKAFRELKESNNWTQNELADHIGKKRSTVANTLRFLELPEQVQKSLEDGSLSAGHAKLLLAVTEDKCVSLHQQVLAAKLSVRELEDLVAGSSKYVSLPSTELTSELAKSNAEPSRQLRVKAPHIAEQELQFSARLGTKVEIREGRGKGRIIIEFYSTDDFERLRTLIL
ncbi:MAG: ParB/RepB/Spo0J family partition protein [Planctomycetota bacterium]